MKIFITDSISCMGKRILHHAIERGHEVCALCSVLPSVHNINSGVQYIQGSQFNTLDLQDKLRGCDAVIHSAEFEQGAQQSLTGNPFLTNVQQLIQDTKGCGIQRMVIALPCAVLGPTSEKPANESWDQHIHAGYTPSRKTAQLYETDQWLREFNRNDYSVITVYPGMLYGPGLDLQHYFINRFLNDYIHRRLYGIPGKGAFRLTFSYIEDVAKGVLLALENGKPGERYILGGEDATLLEFIDIVQSVTQHKPPRINTPLSILRMYEIMEQWKALMSRKYIPKLTPEIMNYFKHHWRYSSQKAIVELGYTRTPLKMGTIKTLESLHFNFPSERDIIL